MTMWTLDDAVRAAVAIEGVCPAFGCHVGLTGGTLYKDGPRKDADFVFYRIRQAERIDRPGLLSALGSIGFEIGKDFGWGQKATWEGRTCDLFFPDQDPSDYSAPVVDYRAEAA